MKGPKNLKNLPPGLRKYWQAKRRGTSARKSSAASSKPRRKPKSSVGVRAMAKKPKSGSSHKKRSSIARHFGGGKLRLGVLSKYLPPVNVVVPLVVGAGVGFASGQGIKSLLMHKAAAAGKPSFVADDLGSAAFDVAHAIAAQFLIPRSLGNLKTGYIVGTLMPTPVMYAAKGLDMIAAKIPALNSPPTQAGPGPQALNDGRSGVRVIDNKGSVALVDAVANAVKSQTGSLQGLSDDISGAYRDAQNGYQLSGIDDIDSLYGRAQSGYQLSGIDDEQY